MFGTRGEHYLARERDIIAGRYKSRQAGKHLLPTLEIGGIIFMLVAGVIAARLVQ